MLSPTPQTLACPFLFFIQHFFLTWFQVNITDWFISNTVMNIIHNTTILTVINNKRGELFKYKIELNDFYLIVFVMCSFHCICFSSSSLSISKNCTIVPIDNFRDKWANNGTINFLLCWTVIKHTIKYIFFVIIIAFTQ